MTYTFWHRGQLIGRTDFEDSERNEHDGGRLHMAGAFSPTPYGRQLLPRLCGILTAASEFKAELDRRGIDPDNLNEDQIENLFETTAAGAHIIGIGEILCDVELRDPAGTRLAVISMGFSDLAELASFSRKHGGRKTAGSRPLPPGAPEFLVSVTLRALSCDIH